MDNAHHVILLAGALGLLSMFAGLFSARFGTPLLLVFLAIGILFGKEGPVGLVFDDFQAAYLIGSMALAVILFQGGLKTKRSMLKIALWPAVVLATAGVAITAGVICVMFALLPPPPLPYSPWVLALLIGAVLAPTDAAAVAVLLRRARLALPEQVRAALEVESGLNDPMSVFLTVLLTQQLLAPGSLRGPCCTDRAADALRPCTCPGYAMRTDSGRPSCSMRFRTLTATATSVAWRASVRDRSVSPITRL